MNLALLQTALKNNRESDLVASYFEKISTKVSINKTKKYMNNSVLMASFKDNLGKLVPESNCP